MYYLLLVLTLFSDINVALASVHYALSEKREVIPQGWVQHSKMPGGRLLPMRIALKQNNLEKLDTYLKDVSNPDSEHYGQHWTRKSVTETFAPSEASINAVYDWLTTSGIALEDITKSRSLGWLSFSITVARAEALLQTEYSMYEHSLTGQRHVACLEYYVPEHIRTHIDFITPTLHFDVKATGNSGKKYRRQISSRTFDSVPSASALEIFPIETNGASDLDDCANNVTPDCLRALYQFPEIRGRQNPQNSFGVVQFTPQSYLGSDLDLFFSNYSRHQMHKRPLLASIDGGFINDTEDIDQNVESNLDLEYAMTLVNPIPVTLFQVGDIPEQNRISLNNFLDAIDASYCDTDDKMNDAVFPDLLPGGYDGPENCGGFVATKVISTSYSFNEYDLTPAYEQRQCNEYAKLGLTGTTFLYCSGDWGVAGYGGSCIDPASGEYNDGTSGRFSPSFPSTCPYILSVGATQIKPNASITAPEVACETKILSGGGFSNVFPLPSYQSEVVQEWFKSHAPPYTADQFNNSRQTRGYPDVSANGAKYVVALEGSYQYHLYGTSASTPTFAAIIALLNEARLNIGKGTIGFISQ